MRATSPVTESTLPYAREPIVKFSLVAIAIWTLLVLFSVYWNINNIEQEKLSLATAEARANWNKDQAFRRWATRHGGLYVKPDQRTSPSPYLAHLPKRDIVTTDGMKLTLMNPAYMMRQMTEEYEEMYGIKGSITGKVLLNPINQPDDWERRALDQFEIGVEEVVEQTNIEGQPYIRLMKPMVMEKGCVKCHGHLGFKVGDIRGGVSVSIPMQPYMDAAKSTLQSIITAHALVWTIACIGILILSRSLKTRDDERYRLQVALAREQHVLEERVISRTQALKQKQQEAEENEQRLDDIMNSAIDSIITIDEQGIIKSFNQSAEKQFQYTVTEAIGQNIKMLMPKTYRNNHENSLKNYLKTGQSSVIGVDRELVGLRKDESTFPMSLAVSEIFIHKQRIFTGFIRDLTESKLAQEKIQKSTDKLIMTNRTLTETQTQLVHSAKLASLGELSAGLAHELNQPLGVIQMRGDMINNSLASNESVDKAEVANHLDKIANEIKRASKIISHLKTFSRQTLPDNQDTVDINWLIDESLVLLRNTLQIQGISLETDFCEELPQVSCDYIQIEQVLTNLLTNAKDAVMDSTEKRVSIRTYQKGDSICIDISDTGCGIAKSNIDKIFDPFFTTKPVGSGTGLGMSISHGIVKEHNGTLIVNSMQGHGSTFTLSLPL